MRQYNRRLSAHQSELLKYMVVLCRKYHQQEWIPGFATKLAESMAGTIGWELLRSEIKQLGSLSHAAGGWAIDPREHESSKDPRFVYRFVKYDEMRDMGHETKRVLELLKSYRTQGTL